MTFVNSVHSDESLIFSGLRYDLSWVPPSPLSRIRKICKTLPETHEVEAWGEPTFRVKNKMFAMFASTGTHHTDHRPALWVKSTPINQSFMIDGNPKRYFSPPYVGTSGWVGVFLDGRVNWTELADLLRDAYDLIAPKRRASVSPAAAAKRLRRAK